MGPGNMIELCFPSVSYIICQRWWENLSHDYVCYITFPCSQLEENSPAVLEVRWYLTIGPHGQDLGGATSNWQLLLAKTSKKIGTSDLQPWGINFPNNLGDLGREYLSTDARAVLATPWFQPSEAPSKESIYAMPRLLSCRRWAS